MRDLYYIVHHQQLGQDTRYLAEGLIVSDGELQQETHSFADEEPYIRSAYPLNDAEDIYYFIQDLIRRGKTTNMKTKRLQTLALREFLNDEGGDLYELLCDRVQYGITRIQMHRAVGHSFYELDDLYADNCREHKVGPLVEFAYLPYATEYCIALNDALLDIEAILDDGGAGKNEKEKCISHKKTKR